MFPGQEKGFILCSGYRQDGGKRTGELRGWEAAGKDLGFWFASKCLTQMDAAFQTGGQTQTLVKTNTDQPCGREVGR